MPDTHESLRFKMHFIEEFAKRAPNTTISKVVYEAKLAWERHLEESRNEPSPSR